IDIPESTDLIYWNSYKIKNGEFSWIDNKTLSSHYSDISNERIGVPQGGALSGLIANIYLNKADLSIIGKKVLYQRFCDDMIIVSDNLE
ncbi:reverse transcriptase domain-containing protein, partial [Streptococcus pneumoniae]|uniref:reverse transcriptase domain-containing protein n=1 Tax=Streptococcus pneumoniae TaxID=1313 RepID=UPI0022A9BD91